MGEAAVADPAGQPEREPRLATQEHCVIARQNGALVTALLVNISARGFCVETATPLDDNERVQVRVLGARLQGTIKWTKGHRAGGTMDRVDA